MAGPRPGPARRPAPAARQGCRCAARARCASAGATSAPSRDELLLCAARVQVGPLAQTFWAFWDRESGEMLEQTRTLAARAPAARSGPRTRRRGRRPSRLGASDGGEAAGADRGRRPRGRATSAPSCGPATASGPSRSAPTAPGRLRLDPQARRRPGRVRRPHRRPPHRAVEARGIEDESAGYHPRHTVWSWSAGVGAPTDGRSVGWNLVEGVNDPPERSERAIWVDGEPFEPGAGDVRRPRGDRASTTAPGSSSRPRPSARKRGEPPVRQLLLPPAVRHLRAGPSPAASSSSTASA